jgi:hypothetical protein
VCVVVGSHMLAWQRIALDLRGAAVLRTVEMDGVGPAAAVAAAGALSVRVAVRPSIDDEVAPLLLQLDAASDLFLC